MGGSLPWRISVGAVYTPPEQAVPPGVKVDRG
jgi:hypothetical protein